MRYQSRLSIHNIDTYFDSLLMAEVRTETIHCNVHLLHAIKPQPIVLVSRAWKETKGETQLLRA